VSFSLGGRFAALAVAIALLATACAAGTDSVGLSAEAVRPVPELDLDGVATALADIEEFWGRALPDAYGLEFEPINGVISYDAANDLLESIPTCDTTLEDRAYAENAFYCPIDDTILLDEGVLFPAIRDAFGEFAASTVLAHEYAHAIQGRLGVFDDDAEPVNGVVLELQADCFAGAWVADLQDRGGGRLGLSDTQIDEALGGLIFVSDPVGTAQTEPGAHGNAFDRVNAFSDGLFDGLDVCATYLDSPPQITAKAFQSSELLTEGNLPVEEVVPLVVAGLELFWTQEFEAVFGIAYEAPEFVSMAPRSEPPPPCGGLESDPTAMEDIATYCTAELYLIADSEGLLPNLAVVGDFAVTYPIVHAWSQQVLLTGLGEIPEQGVVLSGDCVSGAWTRAIFDGQENLGLSAGDIDEAIISFGIYVPTGPNGTDPGEPVATIDRVAAFGAGFFDGVGTCLP
jgi:hypothetical protein